MFVWKGPHRAEIMSPLCLCRAQLSTPTYLDCHNEKPSTERRGCEIMGECNGRREEIAVEMQRERKTWRGEEEDPSPKKKKRL